MFADRELPKINATDEEIREILRSAKVMAIVGLSSDHQKDSYRVASYLKEQGYWMIPVNPKATQILGEKCYEALPKIPGKVDVVVIFRKPEAVAEIVREAMHIEAKTVWMQEGIVDNLSAQRAQECGLYVVMDKCIMKEHKRMLVQNSV